MGTVRVGGLCRRGLRMVSVGNPTNEGGKNQGLLACADMAPAKLSTILRTPPFPTPRRPASSRTLAGIRSWRRRGATPR